MGKLGATNLNLNLNLNTNTALGNGNNVRYNSQEFAKRLTDGYPSDLRQGASQNDRDTRKAAQEFVNATAFRQYWDAELRASVYLNEFIVKNPEWMGECVHALEGQHQELQNNKAEELQAVIGMSDEREPRFVEIIDQDQAEGVIKYLTGMLMIDAASTPATYALLRVGRRIGEIAVMCLKDYFSEPRPSQVCPAIVPMIDPPITPSFPAGHALQSHLMVRLIAEARRPLVIDKKHPDPRVQPEMLDYLALRISENRTVAGLHYLADNRAGATAAGLIFGMLMKQGESQFQQLMHAARTERRTRQPIEGKDFRIPAPRRGK